MALGADAYLTDLFAVPMWMPDAVIQEIEAPNPSAPRRVYLRQQRLREALRHGDVVVRNPTRPHERYGSGEAACIGLALETGCELLINDYRPYAEALTRLGLDVLSVADFIAILAGRGTVGENTALAWLDQLRDTVSDALVEPIIEILKQAQQEEGS